MNARERDLLIEQATTAHRPRLPDGSIAAHPAFRDLDAEGRIRLHVEVERQRVVEAALDPDGLSSTGRAVLARIAGPRP